MSVAALSTEARWCRPDTCVVAACSVEAEVEFGESPQSVSQKGSRVSWSCDPLDSFPSPLWAGSVWDLLRVCPSLETKKAE